MGSMQLTRPHSTEIIQRRFEGKLLFLEHMRPDRRMLGLRFELFNPLAVRATGANIDRRTMDNL